MGNPKVSVIIPVFNAGHYLPRCLDSLVTQTLTDIEIICVNDCSTDNSLSILEEYASKDRRIKIYTNSVNQGVGLSRNIGISISSGEYIGFVDNDDAAEAVMYQQLYDRASSENFDIVRCDVFVHQGEAITDATYPSNFDDGSSELLDEMIQLLLFQKKNDHAKGLWTGGVWNKIYKRSLLEKYHIQFLSEREYPSEDFLFNLIFLLHSELVAKIPESLYHHYHYESSLGCANYSYKNFAQAIRTIEKAESLLSIRNPDQIESYRERLDYRCWYLVPIGILNEFKRNPKGKINGLKQSLSILNHPRVISAMNSINKEELSFQKGGFGIYERVLFFYYHQRIHKNRAS